MTEQPRTVDRRRITKHAGQVDTATMEQIRAWLIDFVELRTDRPGNATSSHP